MKRVYDEKNWIEALLQARSSSKYKVMYSSLLDGFVQNPHLMMIPIDDHLVHRGDGVFEAVRLIENKVYLLDEHLARLEKSAKAIGLELKVSTQEIKNIIRQACELSGLPDAMIRIFVSRGPGDFSTNPYATQGTQLYIVVTEFAPLGEQKYREGVSVLRSQVPQKSGFFATMKSCNYLPNVLMKKESVDLGCDFVIGVNAQGMVLESSTENIGMVDENGYLVHPPLTEILQGCTMTRCFELMTQNPLPSVQGVQIRPIAFDELFHAQEVMMFGTTLDVLPVCFVEEEAVGAGEAGLIALHLRNLLLQDQKENGWAI